MHAETEDEMFLLMLASVAGGLATTIVLLPHGLLLAILCGPIGGSLCAVLAAAFMLHRGNRRGTGTTNDARTDAMVEALRKSVAQVNSAPLARSDAGKDRRAA